MSSIHFMNVGEGDCIFIDHNGSRQTLIDICGGNRDRRVSKAARQVRLERAGVPGNFRMCNAPIQPLDYLADLGVSSIWRFISTHPDMDHLDGLDALIRHHQVKHFWCSGVTRSRPAFEEDARYKEADWDVYEKLRHGDLDGTKSLTKRAGARFEYANKPKGEHDGLYIRSPDETLIDEAEETEEFNDASYVIQYYCSGHSAVFPGDAHDRTWDYVLRNYEDKVSNISLLAAPHHGRKSGRSYEFLDVVQPTLTIFGCAPSEDLAYDAWRNRGLDYITANQAGCIAVECEHDDMIVYIENRAFAERAGGDTRVTNDLGFYYLQTL